MRIYRRPLLATVTAVSAVLVLSSCGGDDEMEGTDMGGGDTTASESETDDAAAEFNDADVMFVQMMIPHHTQAVEMSDMLLAKDGVDERVTALAEQIKAAQGPEIEQMNALLEAWGEEPVDDMGGMDMGSMGSGMMSEEDMQALEAATGPDASRLFLEQMTEHHTGAIEMAQTEIADGADPEALELAQTIIDAQQAEIEQMQEILASL